MWQTKCEVFVGGGGGGGIKFKKLRLLPLAYDV